MVDPHRKKAAARPEVRALTFRIGRKAFTLRRMLPPRKMFHHYAVIVAAIMTSADIYGKGCKKGNIFNARKR